MGISIRAYARLRGVSDMAVRKAITTGRISKNADGTIDAALADSQWEVRTDPSQQREASPPKPTPVVRPMESIDDAPRATPAMAQNRPTAASEPEPSMPVTGSTTFVQARTANEVIKAQTNKVRLSRMKGDLIDRNQALATVFKLARTERDAWLNWPARISAQLAAELSVDAHQMHTLLEREVRTHLFELGTFKATL